MSDRSLRTVRNAVRLLDTLAARGPLRLSALATEMALGKSTVHLLLQTLLAEGMIDFDPVANTYRVGLRVFEIGSTAIEQGGLGARVIGAMEELGRRSNESVSLGVLSAGSILIVQRVESPEILRADIRPGTRMPLHASASGKVLLAAMTDEEVLAMLPAELTATARKTRHDRAALLDDLRHIRARGYASQVDEYVNGIAALATPLFDATGKPLAALSIAGPSARFDESRWAAMLMPAAALMSQLCGAGLRRGPFSRNGHLRHEYGASDAESGDRKEAISTPG
ncbi:MAG: IclR family transcriptional regulator [Thermomicrobiales bacterium]